MYRMEYDAIKDMIKGDELENVKNDIRINKAVDFIMENVKERAKPKSKAEKEAEKEAEKKAEK